MPLESYTIGWICALNHELTSSRAMLDEEHERLQGQSPQDHNAYILGTISGHNVVMACLPAGKYGTESAATVAKDMLRTFPSIRCGLLVGIGGGIPTESNDIRLGDVVVSKPSNQDGGVIQYDTGKVLAGGKFERRGSLNKPPTVLLRAVNTLASSHEKEGSTLAKHISDALKRHPDMRKEYSSPGFHQDKLYQSSCPHSEDAETCTTCDAPVEVQRLPRKSARGLVYNGPVIHYGLVASGPKVIASAKERNRLRKDAAILCFETEAAGLMDDFPCLVIRGISDYADAHKHDAWQRYASLAAAAYAKELLNTVPISKVAEIKAVTSLATNPEEYEFGLQLEDAPEIDDSSFIGRNAELKCLVDYLITSRDRSVQKCFVISGLGGIGKSQLALQFAKRHLKEFTSVFWMKAHSEATLRNSFLSLARRVSERFSDVARAVDSNQEKQAIESIRGWLSRPGNDKWLLIFDNHDDPALPGQLNADAYSIKDYLPHTSQGSILVTTRRPKVNLGGSILKLKHLKRLNESLQILSRRSGRENVESDAGARSLALRLDGLPLALVTAGDYLRHNPESFAEYLHHYEDSWNELENVAEELTDYGGRTLYSTWNLSLSKLSQQLPEALMILRFMAYLSNQDVWFGLFQSAGDSAPSWLRNITSSRIKFDAAMRKLQDYSMVEANYQSGTYALHSCVHDWTLNHLNHGAGAEFYKLALRCTAAMVKDEVQPDYASNDLRLEPHLLRLFRKQFQSMVEKLDGNSLKMSDGIGKVLLRRSKLLDAEHFYHWTLAGKERVLGRAHPSTLDTVSWLADVYRDKDELERAQTLYQRALSGKEASLGEAEASTLNTVNNLAILFSKQGKIELAEQHYDRALAGYMELYGLKNISTLNTLGNLARIYKIQGKLAKSEETFDKVLRTKEEILGPNHPSILALLNSIAELYAAQSKFEKAEEMYERIYNQSKGQFGAEHESTFRAAANLGIIYNDIGKYAESEHLLLLALNGSESIFGQSHSTVLDILSNLGNLYKNQGKLEEAKDVYERVLAGKEATSGPDHMDTLNVVHSLGQLLLDRGDLEESEELLERAITGYVENLGSEHVVTLGVLGTWSALCLIKGDLESAEEMYSHVISGFQAALGNQHISTIKARNNLGSVLVAQGRLEDALTMYLGALADGMETLRPDHPLLKEIEENVQNLVGDDP